MCKYTLGTYQIKTKKDTKIICIINYNQRYNLCEGTVLFKSEIFILI